MRQVNVELKSTRTDDPVVGRCVVERRLSSSAEWVEEETTALKGKEGETVVKREFTLGPNERLVIEGEEVVVPYYVKEQNAAMTLANAAASEGFVLPTIESLNPAEAAIGGADVELHVTGTGFNETSVIVFNGGDEITTYVSPTDISTVVKPSLATVEGPVPVSVRTGNFPSNSLEFTFTAASGATMAKASTISSPLVKDPDSSKKPPFSSDDVKGESKGDTIKKK